MPAPAISAVIPTFNRRAHIGRALDSILGDPPQPGEILVVDDGSTDGTAELIAETYGAAVRVIVQANAGVSAARRTGVLAAQGDWIAFLDSDDEWVAGRSQALAAAAAAAPPEVAWIFGDTLMVEDGGRETSLFAEHGFSPPAQAVLDDPMPSQFPFQLSLLQSSLIQREALLMAGCFEERLSSSEDFLLGFRLALRSSFAAIPQAVTRLYRTSDLAASSLDRQGRRSGDFHRARMIAFREAAEAIGKEPWGRLHAEAARQYSLASFHRGEFDPSWSREQFRFGASPKSLAFHAANLMGPPGLRLWDGLSGLARKLRPAAPR